MWMNSIFIGHLAHLCLVQAITDLFVLSTNKFIVLKFICWLYMKIALNVLHGEKELHDDLYLYEICSWFILNPRFLKLMCYHVFLFSISCHFWSGFQSPFLSAIFYLFNIEAFPIFDNLNLWLFRSRCTISIEVFQHSSLLKVSIWWYIHFRFLYVWPRFWLNAILGNQFFL